jgi:putative membrane protein
VLALRAVREMASTKGEGSRAMEILKERYARGEITREQYEQMRRDLEGR